VLVGTSRKRFLAEALAPAPGRISTARRDLATAVTSVLAAQRRRLGRARARRRGTRDALAVWTRWNGESDGGHA
jgi:dihydropteroate synthase